MLDTVLTLHREDLENVVTSVFATMMDLEIAPSDDPFPGPAGFLTASVSLTGEWKGAACIHMRPEQACSFAARFLGMPPDDAVNDEVRDVAGELANMIGGNLKCTLAPGIRVSIPTVTDGLDYTQRLCGAHLICRAGFQTGDGPCWISLLEADSEG